MFGSVIVVLALLLILALPIYAQGLDAQVALFLALAAAAGLIGLRARAARQELLILSPWAAALALAFLVGSVSHGDSTQAIEDGLPYVLFALGLTAGRGLSRPRVVLRVALFVCVADSVLSLYLMPSFDPGVRSTYSYWKITAGLPLIGLALVGLLRETDPHRRGHLDRAKHWGIVGVLVLGLVFSVSRGMMLAAVSGIAAAAYVRKPTRALLITMALMIGLVFYSSVVVDVGERWLRFEQQGTMDERMIEIEGTLDVFADHPLVGSGLGARIEVDGHSKSYVHNMITYHLWKFGLIGSTLLLLPTIPIAGELRHAPLRPRSYAIGGALAMFLYLVTCAIYKTYYVAWLVGIVVGATLTWLTAVSVSSGGLDPPRRQRRSGNE